MSKVIRVCFGFSLLHFLFDRQNSRHFLSTKREAKPKPIAECARVISRAWRQIHANISNSDWFTELSGSLVIGQSDCFGFDFTTLDLHPNSVEMKILFRTFTAKIYENTTQPLGNCARLPLTQASVVGWSTARVVAFFRHLTIKPRARCFPAFH